MRLSRPAGSAALRRRRSRGFRGRADIGPGFLAEEVELLRALLVIPETTDLTRGHRHAFAIPAIWREKGQSRFPVRMSSSCPADRRVGVRSVPGWSLSQ